MLLIKKNIFHKKNINKEFGVQLRKNMFSYLKFISFIFLQIFILYYTIK